jgi:hypothetical protein
MDRIFMVNVIKETTVTEYMIWSDDGEAAISAVKAKYDCSLDQNNLITQLISHSVLAQPKYSFKELSQADWFIKKNEQTQTLNLYHKECRNKKCIITLSKNCPLFFSSCTCKNKNIS